MELLSFGDTGWGDEMLRACFMTLAVSLCAMAFGLVLAIPFSLEAVPQLCMWQVFLVTMGI
jgi:ABC-type arginine transport system permease subunit